MTAQAPATLDDVRQLLSSALALYRDVPEAATPLREQRDRLDEPLRVAVVGRVKAGKSTLLNALLGERLAPTDAGECTRVVTLYRHAAVPRVVLESTDGDSRVLPIRRSEGALALDLGNTPPEHVGRLVVDWPTPELRAATLVDTPGISSLSADASGRTEAFLEAGQRLPGANALVFLTRSMQPEDLAFLSSFQAGTGSSVLHTTTITVLSRADESGSGDVDALLAARRLAERTAADPAVRAVTEAVVPVAGLLGLAGRLLRQADFDALETLAAAGPAELQRTLLTADLFSRDQAPVPLPRAQRLSLLERFGLFGIRLSVALIRTGVSDAATLAEELVRRSGLAELQRLLAVRFTERGDQLKAGEALHLVERVLQEHPVPGAEAVWAEVERLQLSSHDLVQLALLARTRTAASPFPEAMRAEAERLLGADGVSPAARLGLPPDAPVEVLRTAMAETVSRWRMRAEDARWSRATVDAIDVVVTSCETVLAALGDPPTARPAGVSPAG